MATKAENYLAALIDATKTVVFYARVMRSAIRGYFSDGDIYTFLARMTLLIEDQFARAYRQGLRSVGYDKDLSATMQDQLVERTRREIDVLYSFADQMEAVYAAQGDPKRFLSRVDLWANRYNELVDMGALAGGVHDDLYEWRLGRTEKHCITCASLSGAVMSRDEWNESGYKPQNAPNPLLQCGGWRCDCRIVPTDKERTGLPNIPKMQVVRRGK